MLTNRRRAILALAALAAAALLALPGTAQTYPNRAIRLIVPTAPGGGYDLIGRQLADKLSTDMGQPWVVENRPGSGSVVGTQIAASAPADGYTLVMGGQANIAFSPGLYDKLPYNPATDLVPIAIVGGFSYTLIARKDLPANSLKELIALARAKPGTLTVATAGTGTGQQVAAALLAQLAGIQLLQVPYKGAQPAYTDLFGGRVDLFFDNTVTTRPYLESERVKALVNSGPARDPMLPQVPTGREVGLPDLVMEGWIGLFAPAHIAKPVLEKLRASVARVMQVPDLRKRIEAAGVGLLALSATETEQFVKAEIDKWPQVLQKAGIKGE